MRARVSWPPAAVPVLILATACASHIGRPAAAVSPELSESGFTVLRDQVYSPTDWPQRLEADVYVPDRPGPYPAVLVVHGGGWERRSPEDMTEIAEYLAEHGFVAVNVEYRLAPAFRFPAQLHDVQQAMRWIHSQAEKLSVDTRRIGAYGYSAGAHLVALLAVVSEGGPLDEPYGGAETRLAAVVAGGTPADL